MTDRSPAPPGGATALVLAALASLLVAAATPAAASDADADAIRTWVRGIAASPRWAAGFGEIEQFGQDTVVRGIKFRSWPAGVEVDVDEVTFHGAVTLRDDGGLQAEGVSIPRIEIALDHASDTFDDVRLRAELADIEVDGALLPDFGDYDLMTDQTVTNIAAAYRLLAAFGMDEGRFGPIDLIQSGRGITSLTDYSGATVTGWKDGRIAHYEVGRTFSETPSPDGDVRVTIGAVTGTDYDIGAMASIFEPAPDAGAAEWQTAVGSVTYDGMAIEFPDGALTVDGLVSDDLQVRPGKGGVLALSDIIEATVESDDPSSDPTPALRAVDELMGMFKVGRSEITGIALTATGIDSFRIGRMSLRNASRDYIGEAAIENVEVAIPEEAYFALDRLAVGGIVPPKGDAWVGALAAGVDPSGMVGLLPQMGFLEVAGLDMEAADLPPTRIGRLRIDLDDYVGPLPTSVSVDLKDLVSETATSAALRDAALPIGDVDLGPGPTDLTLRMHWKPDTGTVTVDQLDLSLGGTGALEAKATFEGLDRDAVSDVGALPGAMSGLSLSGLTATYHDVSLVAKVLAAQAELAGVSTDTYRSQMVGALPFMLSFVGSGEFQQQVIPLIQEFLTEPRDITAVAAPPEPVPLDSLKGMLIVAPHELPDVLGISLTAADAADAMRDSIAPEDDTAAPGDDEVAGDDTQAGDAEPPVPPGERNAE